MFVVCLIYLNCLWVTWCCVLVSCCFGCVGLFCLLAIVSYWYSCGWLLFYWWVLYMVALRFGFLVVVVLVDLLVVWFLLFFLT